jgi:hypothetical protein
MSARVPLYMGTTEVEASRSAAEITAELVKAGARQIATDYNAQGKISGLRFVLEVNGSTIAYILPARTEALLAKMKSYRKRTQGYFTAQNETKDRERADRVAWRQLLRWVQAQLAMIDCGLVKPPEVFLPYMLATATGQTAYEVFEERGLKMIAAPEK